MSAVKLEVGSTFAGHVIESVAGQGGMGVVYKARHVTLDVPVALKVITPGLASDASYRERFKRECRLAAQIDHPNVVDIRHAGEEDGVLFVTMRYVEGTDLRALVEKSGRLDLSTTATIIKQVGAALDAAHVRDLIHRDVKPANILISQHPGFAPTAYLTDFGLTRQGSSNSGLTQTGHWVGTLSYVAPEQIEGSGIGRAADIYALGAVAYYCLAGSPPFVGDHDGALIHAHLTQPAPDVRAVAGEIPEPAARAIQRAMAKDPAERYAYAGLLGEALAEAADRHQAAATNEASEATILEGDATVVEPPGTPGPPKAEGKETVLDTPLAQPRPRREPIIDRRPEPEPAKSRKGLLAAIGAGAAALAGIAAFLVLSGGSGDESSDSSDPRKGSSTAGPKVVSPPVDVAGWPFGIASEDDLLITATRQGRELRTFDEQRRAPILKIKLPGRGEEVAVQDGTAYVTLPQRDSVAQAPLDGKGSHTFFAVGNEPRGIVSDGKYLWVANNISGTLSRFDPSRRTIAELPLTDGAEPQDIAIDGKSLWVTDRTGFAILVPPAGEPERFPVGANPRGVAVVDGNVWVANSDDGTVTRLTRAGNRVESIDVGGGPRGVVGGFGRIWVSNANGYVSAIDPGDGSTERIDVKGSPEEITTSRDLVWVSAGPGNQLIPIDPGDQP